IYSGRTTARRRDQRRARRTIMTDDAKKMRPIYPRGAVATWLSSTPAGLCETLRDGAEIFLTGAKKLNELWPGDDVPDRQILTVHRFELALKGFLAKHGLTAEMLRNKPYRHNLDRLYSEAVERGLSLQPQSKELIEAINEYHYKHIVRCEFDKQRT